MQKAIVCKMDEAFLECGTEFSDRFVFSTYFTGLNVTFEDGKTPVLPEYKVGDLQRLLSTYEDIYKLLDLAARNKDYLDKLGLGDFLNKNGITLPSIFPGSSRGTRTEPSPRTGTVFPTDKVKGAMNDVEGLIRFLTGKLSETDRGIADLAGKKLKEIEEGIKALTETASETTYGAPRFIASGEAAVARPHASRKLEDFLLNAVKSDVGYLFLDRNRVRPKGFAIGEHVYTLSLAPGEEVVLEQKTFSKRQITLEEQTEIEKQFDLELSSTLSTEIQEGLERQKSLTDKWGLSLSHTGEYQTPDKLPWGKIVASHTITYNKDVTEANTETRRRSIKDSQTASSKVASKYRALHKTTFKISTEEGFESTSKRVIRNPNKYTPINLHYFKILQALEMFQERYGVRLCWAPFIENPSEDFFRRIIKGKDEIVRKAKEGLPPKPVEPHPTPPAGQPSRETKENWSKEEEANKWSVWGDMRTEYDLGIPVPDGFYWDEDSEKAKQKLKVRTTGPISVDDINVYVASVWGPVDGNVMARVHVGAGMGGFGRHIYIQAGADFIKTQTVTDKVNEDTILKDALVAYRTDLKDWNDKYTQTVEQARKDAEAWELEMLNKFNPVAEMINKFIKDRDKSGKYFFPQEIRNEGWEVDLWQRIFDWESASYVLYPSWWSDLPIQDPLKEPTHFFNASWARLYLPVRIGMERIALRWIFDRSIDPNRVDPKREGVFKKIEEDLKDKRKEWFGDEKETNVTAAEGCDELKEKFLCLARWTELMPTDGTHIEVIQSKTSTVDDQTGQDLKDTSDLRKAILDSEKQNLEIKKKAHSLITQPPSVEIVVKTDTEPKQPS